jgi:hypothetical protein
MSTTEWQDVLEKALTEVFQSITNVEVIWHGDWHNPEQERYIETMKKLRMEELLIESHADRMLIVKHVYEDLYAVVRYGDGAHAIDISKLIRIVFSQRMGNSLVNNMHYVSAHVVSKNIGRWERSIALVLGKRYASKLLAAAMGGRDPGTMSIENLSEVRAFITAAVGECLIFEPEKVDK